MPFDESAENQDDAVAPPRKFAFPLEGEDADGQNEPSIGQRIMQLVPNQVVPDEPRPMRGIDVQQPGDNKPEVEANPSIGQRIVQLGKQEVPPYDIQDGRPVWRQDPRNFAKPKIGQRIMGLAPTWRPQPVPVLSDGSGWSDAQIRPLPNLKPSEIHAPELLPDFNPTDSPRMEQLLNTQAGINYPLRSLQSTPISAIGGKETEWEPNFVDAPLSSEAKTFSTGAASSGSWNKSTPSLGGTQENLQKPLDFNEFASFLGRPPVGKPVSDHQDYFTSNPQPPQMETGNESGALEASAGTAVDTAHSKQGKKPGKPSKVPVPPVTGSVGRGGSNDPADVKSVQQLLNAAIDDDDLMGEKVPEDGKVTDAMLKLLEQYQSLRGLTKEKAIDRNSRTLAQLAANPLFDSRWSKYDDIIKKEVAYYNNFFSKHYPDGFQPLDWRRVKAMLWVEVEGPDVRDPNDWLVWPMQIGKKKHDPGMPAIKYGLENTDRYVPAELRDKLKHQRMTPELNIRAGIAYVYDRAIENWKNVWRVTDPTDRTYIIKKGDTLESLAKRLHTTVGELLQRNNLNKETAKSLQPTHPLKYRLAEEIPQWRDWPAASALYNSTGDPDYSMKVERNYVKIKRRW